MIKHEASPVPVRYTRPVPLQVGQTIFLLPPQVLQSLPFTLPLPLQTGQRIVFAP
jgi:hypothetical protein